MSTAALHTCTKPGCPVRLPRGTPRCPAHAQQRERSRRERTPGRLVPGKRGHLIDYYQTAEWAEKRRTVLQNQPFCRECRDEGRTKVAKFVDHIKPRRHGGTDDIANLQPLCAAHHSEKTNREMRQLA